jgi:ferredoxin-type protein NapG
MNTPEVPGGPGDRRAFFRDSLGRWVEGMVQAAEERVIQQRYLRPPGALPEVGFLAACTRCGECLPVCPPGAIRKVAGSGGLAAGTPYIDPAIQGCTVCPDMPCAAACPTEALTLPSAGWAGYRLGTLELSPDRCVTFVGTTCRACADACPVGERALTIDDAGHPVLRREGCVGCGVCVRACITYPSSWTLKPAER